MKILLHKQKMKGSHPRSYWQSYSDMMAALLLMFILVMASILLRSSKIYEEKLQAQKEAQYEINNQLEKLKEQEAKLNIQERQLEEQNTIMKEQQEKLDKIIGVKAQIIEELSLAFEKSDMSVMVDQSTGSIMLNSSILFDFGKSELKPEGKDFLDEFLPTYFNVLLSDEISPYISEIIIEGHTDTAGNYMNNLKLSQERAFSVVTYCFNESDNKTISNVETLRNIITANGRSWNDLIYDENGAENPEASRRVEFKFRLKDDEMIDAMMEILNPESSGTK